jgi:PAS domain S-box-containing protein
MSDSQPPPDPQLDFQQLQLALEMSGVSVWRMDVPGGQVHINAAGYRLLGLPPRNHGWPVDELLRAVHPDDRPLMMDAAQRARTENRAVEAMARFRHEDGGWRHVLTRRMPIRNPAGELTAFIGMAIDVSERLRDEQRLHEANQRIALIARSAGIGTWEWDVRSGESHWDEQMFLLRGLPPAERAPSIAEMTQMLHPGDQEHVSRQIQNAMAESRLTQYEFRVLLPDGKVRWLASRSMPLLDEQGRVMRRIGVNWDITAGREAEAQRQAQAVAERENEAKSELLARMSHELRTPLNAVLGFTELLINDGGSLDPAARLARLEHIQSAGHHLLALINDVLELARPEGNSGGTHTLQAVPLDTLFANCLPLVEVAAAERGIALRRAPCEPPELAVLADALWLKQVLLNLLTNAVKYNRRGGWVALSGHAAPDGRVCVRVRDGGHGMTPESLAKVFEPFHRAAERRRGAPGVGIGLAVVKTLMARMGGEVRVHSTPGLGSEFELWLAMAPPGMTDAADSGFAPFAALPEPQADPRAPTTAPAPSALRPAPSPAEVSAALHPPGGRRSLLYIEDNPVNVMIVRELAARWPLLDFHSAPDGGTGLVQAAALQPDLMLLDMQLPDLHGLEVMAQLQADPRTRAIRCIALSANAMPEDIRHALASGFADYWTKPLDFAVFGQAMDALIQAPSAPRPATAG